MRLNLCLRSLQIPAGLLGQALAMAALPVYPLLVADCEALPVASESTGLAADPAGCEHGQSTHAPR